MALRGDQEFYFIVTSDGSLDSYPDNKSSSFKIELNDPIDVGDENWEVSLMSINYPYTWTNVGPSAGVYMKYYNNALVGEQKVEFPDYQCKSMEEVVKYIWRQMYTNYTMVKQKSDVGPFESNHVAIGMDELGRTKIASSVRGYDIGMSTNCLRLLGLLGHEQAENMSMEAFERRQNYRNIVSSICNIPVENFDPILIESVKVCESLEQFEILMSPYINEAYGNIRQEVDDDDDVAESVDAVVEEEGVIQFKDKNKTKVLRVLMDSLKALLNEKQWEETIIGVTPGELNPVQRMYIYSNIIQPVDMNDRTVKLLKLVNTRGSTYKTTQEEFTLPTYHSLQKGKISLITVFIATENGEAVSFQSGTVVLTLHFRKAIANRAFNRNFRKY